MPYDGPERRHKASSPEEQFTQDVEGLTRRVLTEKVSLAEIRFQDQGGKRDRLIEAVQQRIIRLFVKIKRNQRALGDTSLVPAIRKRIMRLYNLEDGQLGTPGEMVAVVPPKNDLLADGSPPSRKNPQKHLERELFFFGKLYLVSPGPDFFDTAKEALLSKFIMQCQNERQQERVMRILESLQRADLPYVGVCNGFSVVQVDSEVLDQLNIASLLTEEDLHGAK